MQGQAVWQWITSRISRQWWIALLISVLLHWLLFAQWQWSLWPDHAPESPVIEARLVQKNSLPVPTPAPKRVTPKAPIAKAPTTPPLHPVVEENTSAINEQASHALAAEGDSLASEIGASEHNVTESFATDPEALAITEEDTAGLAPPYTFADTAFAIYVNGDKRPSGSAHIRYEAKDGQYTLQWEIEGSGLLKLLYPSLVQRSQGEVDSQGLRPLHYRYAFGNRASKTFEAKFNWHERLITLVSQKGEVSNDLPPHTQDVLSFMYQFMYVPPLQMMQVALTNGKRIGEYEYAFEGEEPLQIGTQTLQTIHIAHQRGETDEKVELWLATEYRYLPVKIRKIDKNGMVIEQIATQLNAQ